ncbi:MAG: hypothetical protein ABFS03_14590 [Chloroflexota bacterium]
MNSKLTKTASVLAFIIGVMAVLAGGQVLLGKVKDYYVIDWLPIYNFILGLVSAGWTAISIWKGSKIAMLLAKATFASHAVVMLILLTAYQNVVAPDSIVAMTVRLIAWAIILTLLFIQKRRGEGA